MSFSQPDLWDLPKSFTATWKKNRSYMYSVYFLTWTSLKTQGRFLAFTSFMVVWNKSWNLGSLCTRIEQVFSYVMHLSVFFFTITWIDSPSQIKDLERQKKAADVYLTQTMKKLVGVMNYFSQSVCVVVNVNVNLMWNTGSACMMTWARGSW